jgi:hypothetical protein
MLRAFSYFCLIFIIVGTIFLVLPVWLATMYLFYNLFSEYPIMWLSLLGIPAGIYFYFVVYPEDWQKVKDYFGVI